MGKEIKGRSKILRKTYGPYKSEPKEQVKIKEPLPIKLPRIPRKKNG
jgi:hypothetical protein